MNEEIDLLDKEINEVAEVKQRPSFITVLCILTFCGAGLAIITSLFSMLMMGQLECRSRSWEFVSLDEAILYI